MKRLLTTLFLLSSASAPGAQTDDYHLFDSALAQVGMTRQDVRFDQDEMATWGGDLWRTRYFTMLHKNPFKLPKYGRLNLDDLSGNVTNIAALLSGAGKRIDHPIRRGLIGDQLSAYIEYPDTVPVPSITRSKNVLNGADLAPLRERIDLLYRLVDDDKHLFKRGIQEINKDKFRRQLFEYFVRESEEHEEVISEIVEKVDFDWMIAGAEDIAEAARRIADGLDTLPFPTRKTEIKTRRGLIVVGTPDNEEYAYLEPPLLIIDGGGDDVYKFAGVQGGFPLTVIVDIAGHDRYISTDSTLPGIGGGLISMSVVIDKAGNDRYEAAGIAQGSGLFGVGILLDYQGDDVYTGNSLCQGSGVFGIGVLADSSGNDSLYCVAQSQGYGFTRGCGIMVNYEGNDTYVAEDDTLLHPSSQTAEHNTSLAQGTAFGKRADYVDGHSWAGGVGILCDVKGNDCYSAGLFAQGCAYWFSVGMLLDGDGNDSYNGVWYVQGSGAHFGVGFLDDFGGDDSYTATHNMAVGAGHDFTIGYLNERGGNDRYSVPNLSLGGGNANGIGIFQDHAGDDTYITKGGVTLGRANASDSGPRRHLHVFGIFVDGGGNDTYDVDYAVQKTRWIGPKSNPDNPDPFEIGVGIDW